MKSVNKLLYSAIFILGSLGIIDSMVLLLRFNVSVNLGIVLPGVVGLLMVIFSFSKLGSINWFTIGNRGVKKLLVITIGLWVVSIIFIVSMIINAQLPDLNNHPEYVLILGAGLKEERLSPTLESRMKLGLEYLKSNPSSKVIVSGGQGPGENITEAEAMKRYLRAHGIDQSRITKEEKSTSTIENLRFSKEVISQNSRNNEIVIITSDFHMFRAKMLAKRAGLVPFGVASKTPYYILPNSYLREYFAIIKSYVLDR